MKHTIFNDEIRLIQNNDIAAFTTLVLQLADERFYTMPASSTGKYHPQSSLGRGGLVRHTKQVFHIAKTMLDTRLDLFTCHTDVVLSACLLHDIYKYEPQGDSKYTVKHHAAKAVEWIANNKDVVEFMSIYKGNPPVWYYAILACILSHNGVFSTEYNGEFNVEQSIVHTADYIASRKWCEYNESA